MIDTVFGIKVRMSGLCINRCRPIIGRLLDANYRPADNRLLPYRCISTNNNKFANNEHTIVCIKSYSFRMYIMEVYRSV